ncbi:MAG TPA: DUF6252 family protein [Chitinophagales bacterium]|nr:DUF6252 family protein [Chitinophagales bacterium]
MINLYKSKFWIAILFLSVIGLLQSCKKDPNQYEISYTSAKPSSSTWYSDKVTAIIKSDSLLLTGTKKDKSSIAIIISASGVGNYKLSVTELSSIIVLDKDGTKSKSSQFISIDGVISILEKNTDKKFISGSFDVDVVNLENITDKERIRGNFTSKYKNY